MTLTDFIKARLDEWEQEARSHWTMREGTDLRGFGPLEAGYYMVETSGGQRIMSYDEFNAEYMDPNPDTERLAQVAAMRAIVDASVLMIENYAGGMLLDYTRETLRHLAAIWRDHDDYDPAWAPEGE